MSKLIIYHGSKNIIEKPIYHGGKAENDYGFGFYCTENLELAKEWACSNNEMNGFANKYEIELQGLKVLDLTSEKFSVLNWIAVLLANRTFDLSSEIAVEAKSYLIDNFYVNVQDYDVVIGFRADDSYFSFARDFVNNTISVRKLGEAMTFGELGKQVVIVSKEAFNRLKFVGYEMAEGMEYFSKRKTRDDNARLSYLKGTRKSPTFANDLFVIDIMRKGIKNGDSSL